MFHLQGHMIETRKVDFIFKKASLLMSYDIIPDRIYKKKMSFSISLAM